LHHHTQGYLGELGLLQGGMAKGTQGYLEPFSFSLEIIKCRRFKTTRKKKVLIEFFINFE
jgi:hypothetical protein